MLKFFSLIVIILIFIGLVFRRQKQKHVAIMMSAFTIDILMVLYIELTRQAINTSLHPPHPFIVFHVVISVLAVCLYFGQLVTGFQMLKTGILKPSHKKMAIAFVVLRVGNWVTSLFLENFK